MYKQTSVTKLYQKGRRTVPAVRDLNLTIGDGEWLAVQGRTGHGKSTLLLADEPTGNLDEDTRDDIILLLERLWHEEGLTLVLITHDTSLAGRTQSIGVMNKGRLTIRQAADPTARSYAGPPTG
jgi:ABC-type lipoprotein export system ATPase subunit